MKTVAEKFQNYTNTLLGGARVGAWGEKAWAVGKGLATADNCLLSELQTRLSAGRAGLGVACFYREKVFAGHASEAGNFSNF